MHCRNAYLLLLNGQSQTCPAARKARHNNRLIDIEQAPHPKQALHRGNVRVCMQGGNSLNLQLYIACLWGHQAPAKEAGKAKRRWRYMSACRAPELTWLKHDYLPQDGERWKCTCCTASRAALEACSPLAEAAFFCSSSSCWTSFAISPRNRCLAAAEIVTESSA